MKIACVSAQGRTIECDLASLLTPSLRETARVEANQWIKRLRLVRYGALTMRERFTYRGDSLWWFSELYLHKMKRLDRAVATTLALEAAVDLHNPERIVIEDADAIEASAASAFGASRSIPLTQTGDARLPATHLQSYAIGVTARLSPLRHTHASPPRKQPAIAAFVHSAFWHSPDPQDESYIGPVLDSLAQRLPADDLFFVGVGPRRNFRARRWWHPLAPAASTGSPITAIERLATRHQIAESLALWRNRRTLARDITSGEEIRAAGVVRGCDLWPILQRELQDTARLQWPWSVRAMDESAAALDSLQPKAVLTYAEAGGWGRSLILEARRRGIPSIGLQHGFIYRHWLNYLHEADEVAPNGNDRGFPHPDRTLLYDGYAAEHLRCSGHFPDSSLSITGNARLDSLMEGTAARRAARDDVRLQLGVSDGRRLALLTVKFVEIRDLLPAVVDAVSGRPDIQLVIKPHPAETASLYAPLASGRANVAIAPAELDLASLLVAADGLVTMNSTVAVDSLVLGVPALVVGLPSNLSPLVDAGVMRGVDAPEKIGQELQALLYDQEVRHQLAAAAEPFVRRYGLAPDGHAAERAADEILRMIK